MVVVGGEDDLKRSNLGSSCRDRQDSSIVYCVCVLINNLQSRFCSADTVRGMKTRKQMESEEEEMEADGEKQVVLKQTDRPAEMHTHIQIKSLCHRM